MKNETARHYAYQPSTGFDLGLTGRAARFVVAAGLAGALWAVPATALADLNEVDSQTLVEGNIEDSGNPEVTETSKDTEETQVEETPEEESEDGENPDEENLTDDDKVEDLSEDDQNRLEEEAPKLEDGESNSSAIDENPTDAVVKRAVRRTVAASAPIVQNTTSASVTQTSTSTTVTNTVTVRQGHWEVDARSGQLERYWVDANGVVAKNRLVTPDEGAGYYAYALADGRILRGKYDTGHGRVFVADNDGRLLGSDLTESGWVVTDRYDGILQRYYVDKNTRAAISGFFTAPGYGGSSFGIGGEGYVIRTDFEFGGRKWSADNDGRLRSSWYVTDSFGQGLQRYWMGDTAFGVKGAAAVNRLVTAEEGAGYYAYATGDGTILRGKLDTGRGRVYVANNDGKLIGSDMTQNGWVVTAEYDGHLERYYVDASRKAAISGFFTAPGYSGAFGIGGEGYVIRTDFEFGGRLFSADNDGRLRSGWYVTSNFGQGLQRYWMGDTAYGVKGAAARNRLVTKAEGAGYYAYATSNGTILRGKLDTGRGRVYVANNDGKLIGSDMTQSGWVVTAEYDGHLERYYVDASMKAAMSGWVYVPGYGGEDKDGNALNRVWGVGGEGYVLRNSAVTYNGKTYRADNDGRLTEVKTGWSYVNGHWYYTSENPNAHFDMDIDQNGNSLGHYDVLHELWLLVNGYTSGSMKCYHSRTGYLIASSWDACYLAVFEGQANVTVADNWMPLYGWNVANGNYDKITDDYNRNNPGSNYSWNPSWNMYLAEGNTASNKPKFPADNQWANSLNTTFDGSRIRRVSDAEQYFTSVEWTLGYHTYLSSKSELGTHQSYGCQRLDYPNAQWIYNNIRPGTRCLQVRTSIAN